MIVALFLTFYVGCLSIDIRWGRGEAQTRKSFGRFS